MENYKHLVKITEGSFKGFYGTVQKKSTNGEKVKLHVHYIDEEKPVAIFWRNIEDVEYELQEEQGDKEVKPLSEEEKVIELMKRAIWHCTENDFRILKSKKYIEDVIGENGLNVEWKNNREFLLVDYKYGFELNFNTGNISRGYFGKDFSRIHDLEDTYVYGDM